MIEAATEKFEVKREIFRELDGIVPAERHSGLEYLFDLDHQTGRTDGAARSRDRHALLQSRAGDEAGRGGARAGYLAGDF